MAQALPPLRHPVRLDASGRVRDRELRLDCSSGDVILGNEAAYYVEKSGQFFLAVRKAVGGVETQTFIIAGARSNDAYIVMSRTAVVIQESVLVTQDGQEHKLSKALVTEAASQRQDAFKLLMTFGNLTFYLAPTVPTSLPGAMAADQDFVFDPALGARKATSKGKGRGFHQYDI